MTADTSPDRKPADDDPFRRTKPPLTIDATAESGGRNAAPSGHGWGALLVAGLVGGVIATTLGIALHASGVAPSPVRTAAESATAKADEAAAGLTALSGRIAALEAKPAAGPPDGLDGRIAAVEAAVAAGKTRIDALEARPAPVASPPAASPEALADLEARLNGFAERLSAVEATAAGAVTGSALKDLGDRLALLEASVANLSTRLDAVAARPAPAVESERAARAVAIGVVRAAAARGGPFPGDLAMLRTLGFDDAALAELTPLATRGAPSLADLQGSFPPVADAILAATSAPGPDASFLDRVAAFGESLVSIRPTRPIPGATPDAIVSRMEAAVTLGDLGAALAEREALPDSGKAASADWAAAAADRLAIDRLVDGLSAAGPAN